MKGTNNTRIVQDTMGTRLREARGKMKRPALVRLLNESLKAPVESSAEMTAERLKQWEYGNNPIGHEWVPAICEVLKCDVGYLFGEYEEKKREYSDVHRTTGLSEESITQLDRMFHDAHFPDDVGLGVCAKGYTLGHIGILDEIIKSNSFIWLLNQLSQYLIYGGVLPKDAYTNEEQDLTPDEYERFFKWANKRGLEISPRKDISEMYLQTACDVLKNMCRDILKKELEKRG